MILVDEEIRAAVTEGEIGISDFSDRCLMPASYDLRVGEEGFTLSAGRVNVQQEGSLSIQAGDFALVMTHERLRLPTNIVGRFGLRSMYARMGLLATAGPQVDPGFEGKLVIGVVNFCSQTIGLPYLEPFCSLELHRLPRHSSAPYRGPYQGQEHLTDEIVASLPKEPLPLAVMLIRQLVAASPALRLAEPPTLPSAVPRQMRAFEREREAFTKLRAQLLKTNRGQYVVVRNGEAVLFGQHKTKLAREAYERFGYGPLYIGLVEEEPETAHIPTPRVSKRTV